MRRIPVRIDLQITRYVVRFRQIIYAQDSNGVDHVILFYARRNGNSYRSAARRVVGGTRVRKRIGPLLGLPVAITATSATCTFFGCSLQRSLSRDAAESGKVRDFNT